MTSRPSVRRLGWSRLLAWLIDWACTLAWLGVLTLLGVLLGSSSWQLSQAGWQLLIAAGTVAPVTLWLAGWEARGGTPGKRLRGLTVVAVARGRASGAAPGNTDGHASGAVTGETAGRAGFGRALLRNLLKVAVPWQLGHLIAGYFILHPDAETVPGWLIAAIAVVYPLMLWYVISLFVGSGRPPYDLVAGTRVVTATDPTRPPDAKPSTPPPGESRVPAAHDLDPSTSVRSSMDHR